MIHVKSAREIELMRKAGRIAAEARTLARNLIMPGIRTVDIDTEVHSFIVKSGAVPSFLNYNGFPKSMCISINEQVIHGIPGKYRLKDGDLVSIDVGACIDGFHGDCADTIIAGHPSADALKLIKVTRESFYNGVRFARQGCRISDISHAVEEYCGRFGFTTVRDYVGHGIGAMLHEAPEIPNFGAPGHGARLLPGMTLAIEPMVNEGVPDIKILRDKWTVVTGDGKLSAHYENTILITDGDPEILTVTSDGTA